MVSYRAEKNGISRYIQAHHIPKYTLQGYSVYKIEDEVETEVLDVQAEVSNAEPMSQYFKPGGESQDES